MQGINELKEEYCKLAIIEKESILKGDSKTGNKSVKKLVKIYKLMEKDKNLAVKLLALLLEHPEVNVRLWAASHALGLGEFNDQSLAVLGEIKDMTNIGILRLNAEMVLKVYQEKGSLKFY